MDDSTIPGSERLVSLSAPRTRAAALSLAARLWHAGIPSMLLPEPARPGAFSVAVPRRAAAEAARRLAIWASELAPREDGYRTMAILEQDEEVLPTRARRVAAFFALGMGFGLGHFYAREHLAGLILALAQLGCLVLSATVAAEALYAFPALMALDAWGAVGAVERENDGQRRDPSTQLAVTLPAVALLVATTTVCAAGLRAEPARTPGADIIGPVTR